MITAIVFLPLLAALIAGLGQRIIGAVPSKILTTAGLFASCALAWPIFIGFLQGTEAAHVETVLPFIRSGALTVDWALRVDALTAVMLVVITSVSALVHLYSIAGAIWRRIRISRASSPICRCSPLRC